MYAARRARKSEGRGGGPTTEKAWHCVVAVQVRGTTNSAWDAPIYLQELYNPVRLWLSPCTSFLLWWKIFGPWCKYLNHAALFILTCCSFYLEFDYYQRVTAFVLQAAQILPLLLWFDGSTSEYSEQVSSVHFWMNEWMKRHFNFIQKAICVTFNRI